MAVVKLFFVALSLVMLNSVVFCCCCIFHVLLVIHWPQLVFNLFRFPVGFCVCLFMLTIHMRITIRTSKKGGRKTDDDYHHYYDYHYHCWGEKKTRRCKKKCDKFYTSNENVSRFIGEMTWIMFWYCTAAFYYYYVISAVKHKNCVISMIHQFIQLLSL